MQSVAERDQSIGLVTHDLINKLSAIIGNCDLLLEATEQGSEHARRLNLILEMANAAAMELKKLHHQLARRIRSTDEQQGNVA
jgi:hypothetical protein